MNGAYIVGVTLLIVFWIFILLLCITPWIGISVMPYLVLFTFVGAGVILLILYAYNVNAFDNAGWETVVILFLFLAAIVVGIFMAWYFIRKNLKKYAHEIVHKPRMMYDDCGNEIGYDMGNLKQMDAEYHHDKHHEHRDHRDPSSNIPLTPEAYHDVSHYNHRQELEREHVPFREILVDTFESCQL